MFVEWRFQLAYVTLMQMIRANQFSTGLYTFVLQCLKLYVSVPKQVTVALIKPDVVQNGQVDEILQKVKLTIGCHMTP